MFAWIRKKVAAAVLGGVQDAFDLLEQEKQREVPELPEGLRLRLENKEEEQEPARKKRA
jgi:hypothetical protein